MLAAAGSSSLPLPDDDSKEPPPTKGETLAALTVASFPVVAVSRVPARRSISAIAFV